MKIKMYPNNMKVLIKKNKIHAKPKLKKIKLTKLKILKIKILLLTMLLIKK